MPGVIYVYSERKRGFECFAITSYLLYVCVSISTQLKISPSDYSWIHKLRAKSKKVPSAIS